MEESFSRQHNDRKFRILAGIILVIFVVMVARLWMLQIMQGANIMVKSRANQTRVTRINAPRGFFYDRNGEILVSSRISRNVSVVPEDIKKRPEVLERLSQLLKMPVTEIQAKLEPNPKAPRNPYQYVTICKDIDPTTAIKILEAQIDLPGVEVDEVPVRHYKYGEYASHTFGYIREIDIGELATLKYDSYKLGDLIGKNGLEQTYERYLRGVDGGRIFEVDIYGRRTNKLGIQEPEPGNNLHLTIDHKLQLAAEQALDEQLAYLQKHSKYKNARSGVAIAMDSRNGNILAMVSKPGYDPNLFVGSISQETADQLYNNNLYPLLNRAINGEYSPGSTFKPVTVLAALEENQVKIGEQFYCSGYDPIWKHKFKCWVISSIKRFHGWQNVTEGLKNSCNIVMAELSRRVGPDTLARYARSFGFGRATGIELSPGEKSGLVADPAWKQMNTREKVWYPLETMMFGIGQGYLTVTPLQLTQFYAAMANNGTIYRPQLVSKITDNTGETIREFTPFKTSQLNVDQKSLDVVKEGLKQVVSEGTAAGYFRGFPLDKYPIAGKTGTAERPPYDDTGVFASFAPVNNPELVVVVLVEEGGGSGSAIPVARKIFETYFDILPPEAVKKETPKIMDVPLVEAASDAAPLEEGVDHPETE